MKVAVFTTSYPRGEGDFAGRFVADLVDRVRERGIDVTVVGPAAYRHFGLASGRRPFAHNLRRRPWAAPATLFSMAAALRRAARDADLVHAHWLASGLVASLSGRPFVLTLHGTGSAGSLEDVRLMARAPRLVGRLLRRARVVLTVTEPLAEAARRLGARDVRFVSNGVEIPPELGVEAEPPEILFVGRLAPEKGIPELLEATAGRTLVLAGDGPLRAEVPGALGFVPREEVARLLGRAAVFALPSHREGLPLSLLEAMAHGRAVVTTPVGGIPSIVEDGVTGLLVPPGDPVALRAAIGRLLADEALRRRLGAAARERVAASCSWERVVDETIRAYRDALAPG
jgi:glycosyltransferase involved in cell wall biosynthesis